MDMTSYSAMTDPQLDRDRAELRDRYIELVNTAVENDSEDLAYELAASYADEDRELVAAAVGLPAPVPARVSRAAR